MEREENRRQPFLGFAPRPYPAGPFRYGGGLSPDTYAPLFRHGVVGLLTLQRYQICVSAPHAPQLLHRCSSCVTCTVRLQSDWIVVLRGNDGGAECGRHTDKQRLLWHRRGRPSRYGWWRTQVKLDPLKLDPLMRRSQTAHAPRRSPPTRPRLANFNELLKLRGATHGQRLRLVRPPRLEP